MLTRPVGEAAAPPRPLRVAVLTSYRAPGLEYLLEHDARRGTAYEIVAAVGSTPETVTGALLARHGVPWQVHDIHTFYRARAARLNDLSVRPSYDVAGLKLIAPHRPDVVVLCGYLHIVTAPILDAFPNKVVNIHDADLTLLGDDGLPRYRGLRSVRDAVFAGERSVRSTVHLATPRVDVGPLLVRSQAFVTHPMVGDARRWGATDILKAYAYAQREWMMRAAWGPMLARALELIATDAVRVLDGRAVVAGGWGPEDVGASAEARGAARTAGGAR